MNSKYLYISSLLFFLFLSSCEKDKFRESRDRYQDTLWNLDFSCPEVLGDVYFHGFLNGTEFCYKQGYENRAGRVALTTAFTTDVPEINTANPDALESSSYLTLGFGISAIDEDASYLHFINISSPSEAFGISFYDLVKKHIRAKGDLPIRSELNDADEGFNIQFDLLAKGTVREGNLVYTKSTAMGLQPDNAYLRISQLDIKTISPVEEEYQVTFEFGCSLYNSINTFFKREHFGDLTDCTMQLNFRLIRPE